MFDLNIKYVKTIEARRATKKRCRQLWQITFHDEATLIIELDGRIVQAVNPI